MAQLSAEAGLTERSGLSDKQVDAAIKARVVASINQITTRLHATLIIRTKHYVVHDDVRGHSPLDSTFSVCKNNRIPASLFS